MILTSKKAEKLLQQILGQNLQNTAKHNKHRPNYNLNSDKHTPCHQTAQHGSIQPKTRPNGCMNSTSGLGKPNVQICSVHVYSNVLVVLYASLDEHPMV